MGRINCGDGDGGEPARSPLGRRAFAGQIPKDGIGSDVPRLWKASGTPALMSSNGPGP